MEFTVDLGQISLVVGTVAGIIGLTTTMYRIWTSPLKKYEGLLNKINSRIGDNSVKLDRHDEQLLLLQKDIKNIYDNMETFNSWISTEAMTVLDILNHEIDGNHVEKLKDLRQQYQSFLMNTKHPLK